MRYIWVFIAYLALLATAVVSCGGKGNGNSGTGGTAATGTTGTGTGNSTASAMGGSTGTIMLTTGTGGTSTGSLTTGSGGGCPTAMTCQEQGFDCGDAPDGCNGTHNCGTCPAGEACGAGNPGKANVCGMACTPKSCGELGFNCGPQGDGCGGTLMCGTCSANQTCGGGGPGKCGTGSCMKATCMSLGNLNCGTVGDNCGGTLNCGTCGANQSCGAGNPGKANICGNTCTPKTCAQLGAHCGPEPDGCGGLLMCGFCVAPQTCQAGACTSPTPCTGLCMQQQMCSNPNVTTTLTGTVTAPNGVDPLTTALVYIPNGGAAPTYGVQPFPCGITCGNCSAGVTGSPLVSAVTGIDGKFTLTNVPVGNGIPIVIQLGRWRRQFTINVPACVTTPVPGNLTNMPNCRTGNAACPAGKAKGDIPLMAFSTGSVDGLECVMHKIGVDESEFTAPAGNCGGGRIHMFTGITPNPNYDPFFNPDVPQTLGGATIGGSGSPTEDQLWSSQAVLNKYDMVLFPCQGAENMSLDPTGQSNVVNYANMGGRIFATHFSYDWLYDVPPFSTTANWNVDNSYPYQDPQNGYINMTFPEGNALAQWLQLIGASTTLGQIQIGVLRHDFDSVVAPSLLWMSLKNDMTDGNAPMHYTFNTPVGALPANQCGRVVYDDFHVEDLENDIPPITPQTPWPQECAFQSCTNASQCQSLATGSTCTAGLCVTPQEKLLEFMLFDLASCVTTTTTTCTPKTCAQQGINCGPASDTCGAVIQCGNCGVGETCGGGGTPSVCGMPQCTPKSCAQLGFNCGPQGDGCGGTLMCGNCGAGETCGGGGPGMCGMNGCTPKTCAQLEFNCGTEGDGCGGTLNCGMCSANQTCGGGGTPGQCGNSCKPKTCVELNANCGSIGDGCGAVIQCGNCVAPLVCGYNAPNQCGSPAG